jgi:FkbM family methyltransferase
MRVFLDVGAHVGETLPVALDRRYGFDRVHCFEPVSACWERLERHADARVVVHRFGLLDSAGQRTVHAPGSLGASLFDDVGATGPTEVCRFARASDWVRANVAPEDVAFAKINCEGAECDIITDLLEAGMLGRIRSVLVHFDAAKHPSIRHRVDEVKRRLLDVGVTSVVDARDVPGQSHVDRVARWLDETGARVSRSGVGIDERAGRLTRTLRFSTLPRVVRRVRLGAVARAVMPAGVYARMKAAILGYPPANPGPDR